MEAVSLTCDNTSTTDVCPGTELTCTCSISNDKLIWTLPGSRNNIIVFDNTEGVGSNSSNGIFFAVITNTSNNTGVLQLESMLIYTATEPLVNVTIKCSDIGAEAMSTMNLTVTYTLAG